jgi:ferredoxin
MSYKTTPVNQFPKLVSQWIKKYDVTAPAEAKNGLEYKIISDPAEMVLNNRVNTTYAPKAFFLPQSEKLFTVAHGRFQAPELKNKPRLLLGVRPCDARAFWLLDTVFLAKGEEDAYWQRRRADSLVISFGCDTPCASCFCTSVGGGAFDKEGSDIQMAQLEDVYVFEAFTKMGSALLEKLPDADASTVKKTKALQKASAAEMPKAFDSTDLRDHLYTLFEDDLWKEVAETCLGCGVCTYLCPTCYCFDIVDEVQRGERVRNWDTCMFRVYSQEASGHNPRPNKAARTRQRVMHKYAYWIDSINEFGCTGCGRCVVNCPVNIDIREIVSAAQARSAKMEAAK